MSGRARDERARAADLILDRHAHGEPLAPDSPDEAAYAAITEILTTLPADAWQPIPARLQRSRRAFHFARRRARWLATAGAVVCFALGIAIGGLLGGDRSPGTPAIHGRQVALRPLPGAGGSAAFATVGSSDQLTLSVVHLRPSPPGTYYELWLMTSLRDLAPVTSFRVGQSGRVELAVTLPSNPRAYKYLDISVQKLNAGPEHSADSVLRGSTI